MKILFICFYESNPPTSGAASVTFNIARHASGEKILIQSGQTDNQEYVEKDFTVITIGGAFNSRWQKAKGLLNRIQRAAEQIKLRNPDVVVLEGASWVLYHWLLLRRIRNCCLKIAIVYHAHNVEYFLRREKNGGPIASITRWAEGSILRQADLSFAVSDVDRRHFETLYAVRPRLLPNGVDMDMFDSVGENDIAALKIKYGLHNESILFMGSYDYKPNREAIDFLAKSVMPEVVNNFPEAQLVIIGGKVPYKETWLINPGTVSYGQVPVFAKACRVGVAPIFSGSGTRLKILECMAAGIPVVATAKGAEGLIVKNGQDILIVDRPAEFAERVINLLNDRELSALLGTKGREGVELYYSWKIIMAGFNKELLELVGADGEEAV